MIRSKNDLRRFRSWARKIAKDIKENGVKVERSDASGGVTAINPDGRIILFQYSPKGRSAGQRKRRREHLKNNMVILQSLDRIEAKIEQDLNLIKSW